MAVHLNPRQVRTPVTVQTLQTGSAWGDRYLDPRDTRCLFDGTRKLVRDTSGTEVVSQATLLLHPGITPDAEAWFTPGSKVTVRGHDTTVLSVSPVLQRGRLVCVEAALA